MRGDLKDIPATVLRIEYSPERSSHIALVQYQAWQHTLFGLLNMKLAGEDEL